MTLPDDPAKWAMKAFEDDRNFKIDRLEQYLNGDHPVAFATSKFRKTFGDVFRDFSYNRLDSVINAHADRLQVTGISSNDKTLAAAAQAQWDANQMDVRENEATGHALGLGDGFVIVEKHPVSGDVHYWMNDPRMIRVHYSDEVPGQIDLAVKRWIGEDKYARMNLYFADRVEKIHLAESFIEHDSHIGWIVGEARRRILFTRRERHGSRFSPGEQRTHEQLWPERDRATDPVAGRAQLRADERYGRDRVWRVPAACADGR